MEPAALPAHIAANTTLEQGVRSSTGQQLECHATQRHRPREDSRDALGWTVDQCGSRRNPPRRPESVATQGITTFRTPTTRTLAGLPGARKASPGR
eukprot:14692848-Alexandrium_andersonii.AAC.1